jgi:hypothetical protein
LCRGNKQFVSGIFDFGFVSSFFLSNGCICFLFFSSTPLVLLSAVICILIVIRRVRAPVYSTRVVIQVLLVLVCAAK